MVEMNTIQALNSALDLQLQSNPNVLVFGEDVGYFGGSSESRMDCRRSMGRIACSTRRSQKVAS